MESFKKRQKEMRRLDRQRDKAARRMQRKQDRASGLAGDSSSTEPNAEAEGEPESSTPIEPTTDV